MPLTPELLLALINFATKFGLDAAIAISQNIGNAATIDDAIAALNAAKSKTADDYLKEAQPPAPPTPPQP